MFREKWSQLRNSITKIPSKMGSWMSFFDLKQFSFPASVTELSLRCPANLQVFYANYLVCCLLLLTYCLIASPFLLLGMAIFIILFYVIMKINKPIMVGGKEFTRNQQLIALALVSIPLFLLLGITSTFFWVSIRYRYRINDSSPSLFSQLIGASTCLIGLHSIFHESPKSPVDSVAEGDNVADSNGFQVITAT